MVYSKSEDENFNKDKCTNKKHTGVSGLRGL